MIKKTMGGLGVLSWFSLVRQSGFSRFLVLDTYELCYMLS